MVAPTYDEIVRAPKALLHDHLDGGLRPATVLELAEPVGHRLPADDPVALQLWFESAADSGSLERYLETFPHTVAVMQTTEALHRVAYECALDLAADGVVYAEVRFAPEQHLSRGLSLDEAVEAVLAGFRDGSAEAAQAGTPIRTATLLTAMRHAARSMEIAELAVRYRDLGVVGFDIAGAEAGYPPTRHLAGAAVVRRGPAGPRRAHRRRHHRQRARAARGVCAGQADPAGAVPVVQRADRGRALDRGTPHRAPS